ncbi:DEAD/DEAH box helicase [Paludifilum halophilum]|uniref:Type I restriction enzyme endonuclease subunit n=1 Tax=Paludifilum halophilum TaxID=1642702 RepID=A0A235B4N6_9BACL|nr:HsdR family type I site-specific deoxyribonuclease [Paludifilum halophilum]OYD07276.1 DEAD/DEAH box helicase [Paludifilum halophilum]
MQTRDWTEKTEVENRLITQLKGLGYRHVKGSDLNRGTQREVVLEDGLSAALQRLNPWIDDNSLRKVLRQVTHIEAASLMEANLQFHEMLVSYLSVQQDIGRGKKSQTVKLIDFDRPETNEFLVVDQFRVVDEGGTVKPDLTIFVNGLPLVVIECKASTTSTPVREAVKQLRRYQRESERLFHYNQILIATCDQAARAGTVGAQGRHYSEWKDPWPLTLPELGVEPTPQEVLTAGMLRKENLLDLVRNFIVFEAESGRRVKKLARYQQFRAVNKALERIRTARDPRERGGVVWHTQGSGKSLTMVYLSVKLRREPSLHNPSIVVVTDRTDLDDQISRTFLRCGFPNPVQADSVADLRQRLTGATAGVTVMTTVQKFQEREKEALTEAENLFVLVDESHRTQYKELALNMRTALPNACYLGFTGTPIDKEDKSTVRTFGPYLDTYTIQQAVDDGATVPIFYQGRMPQLQVMGNNLDKLFDRYFRDYPEEERERIRKQYAKEEVITAAPQRVREVAMDILEHYEEHIRPNGFKAQIVAISREAAVRYKQTLDELNGPESAVIFSAGHNDDEFLKPYHLSKEEERRVIERFKKPLEEDSLAFLIVCDKLLTGFDAPIEQVMYLDKPIREHNLLQAIARVNRRYEYKHYGLIIDYFGVSGFLHEALSIFREEDVKGAMHSVDSELPRLQTRHRAAMRFFDGVDASNLNACVKVLESEDIRLEFDLAFQRFSRSMDMVMPDPKARPYVEDLKFLGKVRQAAKTRYRDPGLDLSDCGEKVKRLITDHLQTLNIEVLHDPVDILSSKFEERLERAGSDEAKASEMEHAIRHEIRVKMDENPVYYTSLKEKLENLIAARRELRMDDKELVLEMQRVIDGMRGQAREAERKGFTRQQYPFYQLLVKVLGEEGWGEERIREMTGDLTAIIQEHVVPEWTEKVDAQREMRREIKHYLRDADYRDHLDELALKLMDLARIHYRQ